MINELDVMAVSEDVERDSLSGNLTKQLLAEGHTLYGKNLKFPGYIERITPDGRISLGKWRNGQFEAEISVLADLFKN
ncbi:hypothetical protein [Paraglaciecola arctica]|uniref:Uncharacterized protein n=1 Tax=Paraglaciecola arctica BSs20135 TaxID=493475 RepID=K6Y4X3_9ALTE|nr:hypothetical protein [Paraglaciecola arctica]GAC19016.1 hypothetical protein GARC_2049 [Paraglaciecola arctica BSs20135]|tara:strand:+ start:2129 stop:2362 length:234 start_codon:yes stop_codon:yes gene_type:complete